MPKQFYVKLNKVFQKIKKAENEKTAIYIHAPVGCGKTAAVQYYFRKRKVCWMTGEDGLLPELKEPKQIPEDVIVVDDISWIVDEKSRKYVCFLIRQRTKQVVLMGRSRMPAWLMEEYASGNLFTADERDLLMDRSHVEQVLAVWRCEYTNETIKKISDDTKGLPLGVVLIAMRLKETEVYSEAVLEAARIDLYHYFDKAFFERWDRSVREMLLAVSFFPNFNVQLASTLTGNSKIPVQLEYAMSIGDYLNKDFEGNYSMRPMLQKYLQWKQSLIWADEERNNLHKRAALYYELEDAIPEALEQYRLAGDEYAIVRLLIKNIERHPGTGHYYETRKYYFSLSEEKLTEYPVLIAGMSMLYSLILQPEKSEEWYEKLCTFSKNPGKDTRMRKDAKARIVYLDIALPHRGITKITDILKNAAILCLNHALALPEFSVTSNMPSIMNGGKDFCEWSRIDKELAKVMKKPVEIVLGRHREGLVNIALAESAFEKSSMEDYEIMSLLSQGYSAAESKGKIEMCFAALGLLIKIHVQHNQVRLAKQQLKDFENRTIQEDARQLQANIHALETWLYLISGDLEHVKEWVETAPNEITDFYILDRYQYLIKLRCYMALGQYDLAWNLSERLDYYFTKYKRYYMQMENTLLRAIISRRLKRSQWKELFQNAYHNAESYHFSWLIAQEGIAVLPLLKKCETELKTEGNEEYYMQTITKTENMACTYPSYLNSTDTSNMNLTEMEKKILSLHMNGRSTAQILELCQITERTLKFHNSNIYKKLGVKNKSEAIVAAKQEDFL